MIWRRTRPGLAIGPRRLNTVGMPISRRGRRGEAERRVEAGGEAEADAGLLDAAPHAVGRQLDARRRAPRSTSAVPHSDDAPRAPCLHTGTPAPATTIAAIVDTLIECERSPPVPTMSTARRPQVVVERHQLGRRRARRRAGPTARRPSPPWPAGRRRTRSAGPAWRCPPRIVAIAARAWSAVRSRPASSSVSSPGQPPWPSKPCSSGCGVGGGAHGRNLGAGRDRQRPLRHSGGAGASGAAAALADDPTTLALGRATPHAGLLAGAAGRARDTRRARRTLRRPLSRPAASSSSSG